MKPGLDKFMRTVYPQAAMAEGEYPSWEAFAEDCLARWIREHMYWREKAQEAQTQAGQTDPR